MLDFWTRVKKFIDKENTTWLWVAQQIGVSQQRISGWLTRDVPPNCIESVQIAKLFGTTVEYLVTGEEKEAKEKSEGLTELEIALIEKFRLLDKDGKISALNYLNFLTQQLEPMPPGDTSQQTAG